MNSSVSKNYPMPLKILYIDGDGPFGGASRSLFEAVKILPADQVSAFFVVAKGTSMDFYSQVATDIITTRGLTKFDNTEYGHYRGLRWLVLIRELFYIPFTCIALFRAKNRWKLISLIHVNEITAIFTGLLAKMIFKAPLVIHVRSSQWINKNSWRSWFIDLLLRNSVDSVIAIDETVRATLPKDIQVFVVHNSFSAEHSKIPDENLVIKFNNLPYPSFKVGFVGNLHISKGIFDLLEAAKILRMSSHRINFIIVGGYTRLNHRIEGWLLRKLGLAQNLDSELAKTITQYGLLDSFHLFGATYDIQSVYDNIDIICFPSHFNAPGRPIFEAAFSGIPCITCITNPKSDTVIPGQTGIIVPSKDPQALATAINYLANNRNEVARMGKNAKQLAQANFCPQMNAKKLIAIYLTTAKNLPTRSIAKQQ